MEGGGEDGEGGVGFAPKGLARWAYKEPISSYSIYIGPWCDLSAPIRPPVTKAESYNIPILPTVSYVARKKFGLKDCIR